MILSKKEETPTAFTLEQCKNCNNKTKRKFKAGDFVFKESSECKKCSHPMLIVKIFGEVVKEPS